MGIIGILPKSKYDADFNNNYLDILKMYENDPSFNTMWVSNRFIYPIIPTDISLNVGDNFTYFDEYTNKSYKITLNHNELPGDKIKRIIKFTNPPFNKNFMTDPSFNLNDYDDQQSIYNDYYNILNSIHKNAYYMIDYFDFYKNKIEKIIYNDNSGNIVDINELSYNEIDYMNYKEYSNKFHMNIYCSVFEDNNDELKLKGKSLTSKMFYIDNLDISNIVSKNIYTECYNYIKPLIKDELDYLIKDNELFRYLDISSTLTDV